jgi:hypothetical protein
MKKTLCLVLAALLPLACKKTGENEYEVQKPVIGTQTDTVRVPDVNVNMDSARVAVPDVDVKRDSATVPVPKADVKRP